MLHYEKFKLSKYTYEKLQLPKITLRYITIICNIPNINIAIFMFFTS